MYYKYNCILYYNSESYIIIKSQDTDVLVFTVSLNLKYTYERWFEMIPTTNTSNRGSSHMSCSWARYVYNKISWQLQSSAAYAFCNWSWYYLSVLAWETIKIIKNHTNDFINYNVFFGLEWCNIIDSDYSTYGKRQFALP